MLRAYIKTGTWRGMASDFVSEYKRRGEPVADQVESGEQEDASLSEGVLSRCDEAGEA